jgi:bifunctional non-homologous end joining protein LigD
VLKELTLPAGFIAPCLPTKAQSPPSGPLWLHEIKHDGFRVIARKDGKRVRLYSRPGNDLTYRFPLIVESVARLRPRSCIIDGEAVACDDNGMTNFDRVRYRRNDASVFLYAFDLIEVNGDDLRRDPLEVRKATLANIVARAAQGGRKAGIVPHAARVKIASICSRSGPACTSPFLRIRPFSTCARLRNRRRHGI